VISTPLDKTSREARHAVSRAPGQFQETLHTLANIAIPSQTRFRSALEQAPDADVMLNIIREYGKNSFVFRILSNSRFTSHVSRLLSPHA